MGKNNAIKEFFDNLTELITHRVGKKSTKTVAFASAGCVGNGFVGVGKLVLSIITLSFFAFSSAIYSFAMLGAKVIALIGIIKEENVKKQYKYYRWSGVILLIASASYIIYSLFEFFHPSNNIYNNIVAISIAAFTFFEIAINVRGIVIERRNRTPLVHGIKIINLASSLIALVLTQSALLSIGEEPIFSSSFNGLLGIIMGCCAFALGIFMIIHIEQMRQGKDYFQYYFQIENIIKEKNYMIKLKPIKIVGEYDKTLYVNIIKDENSEFEALKSNTKQKVDINLEEKPT